MIKRLRLTAEGYAVLADVPPVPTDGSMIAIGRVVAVMRRI